MEYRARGRGVEGAGFLSDKVPHCDKAINAYSVSQWVKCDAVTDSASVWLRACVSLGLCAAEIIPKDNGPCVSETLWQSTGEISWTEGDIHTISNWPTKSAATATKSAATALFVQRLGTCGTNTHSSRYKPETEDGGKANLKELHNIFWWFKQLHTCTKYTQTQCKTAKSFDS